MNVNASGFSRPLVFSFQESKVVKLLGEEQKQSLPQGTNKSLLQLEESQKQNRSTFPGVGKKLSWAQDPMGVGS